MPWGSTWEIVPLAITGQPIFDYFFTLVICFGIAAVMIGLVINVVSRS